VLPILNQIFFYPILVLSLSILTTCLIKGKLAVKISSILASIACVFMLILSINVLIYSNTYTQTYILRSFSPIVSKNFAIFRINIDNLSGLFVFVIGLIGFLTSIYSYKYMDRYSAEHLGFYSFNYSLFLLSMYMAVIVSDLFWFIVFWELMTLSSQFLVSFEKEKRKALWAGYKYFTITKIGSEFLIAGTLIIILLFNNYDTSYLNIKINSLHPIGFLAILFFFIGLAIKSAITPFHNWLPDAHPEAPSHVSALLSGVMIKIPVYMMIRLFYMFTSPNILWGIIVSTTGVITIIVGALYGLIQTDTKRLLAYSSIEQIGYIILGLGTSIILYSEKLYVLSLIALFGTLYHLINHALYKSALFLTAGSVVYSTGSRNMNKLGGLAKYMPYTSIAALIASLAIMGIPPLNGFMSKWSLYCSFFSAGGFPLIYGVFALFASSVTAGMFIKYYTTVFTRSTHRIKINENIKEAPLTMIVPQLFLVLLCIVFGLLPIIPYKIILPAITRIGPFENIFENTIYVGIGFIKYANVSMLYPLILLLAVTIPLLVLAILTSSPNRVEYDVWTCGSRIDKRLIHYPAQSYFREFRENFIEFYELSSKLYNLIVIRLPRITQKILLSIWLKSEDASCMFTLIVFILIIIIALLRWVQP